MKKPKAISIPSVVQLPGGVRLEAVPFKVIERDENGAPLKFEILPRGTKLEGPDMWALFADDASIRAGNK